MNLKKLVNLVREEETPEKPEAEKPPEPSSSSHAPLDDIKRWYMAKNSRREFITVEEGNKVFSELEKLNEAREAVIAGRHYSKIWLDDIEGKGRDPRYDTYNEEKAKDYGRMFEIVEEVKAMKERYEEGRK